MRIFLIISAISILFGCNRSNIKTVFIPDDDLADDINPRDTCIRILNRYASEDTFLYQRYYDERTFTDNRFSYVRTGTFIYPDRKSGILVYAPSDSTAGIELYSYESGKWTLSDKKMIPHKGMLFFAGYSDYNFDGINDIYINLTVSNGLGLTSGLLFTVNQNGFLVPHPETMNIRDMVPDSSTQTISARKALYCRESKSVCDEKYQWVNQHLVLISPPCVCPD